MLTCPYGLDERKLIEALAGLEGSLTEEEKQRNTRRNHLLFVGSASLHGPVQRLYALGKLAHLEVTCDKHGISGIILPISAAGICTTFKL